MSVSKALESIEAVGGNIVGIVFNDVNLKDGMGRYGSKKYGKYSHYTKYSNYEAASKNASKK